MLWRKIFCVCLFSAVAAHGFSQGSAAGLAGGGGAGGGSAGYNRQNDDPDLNTPFRPETVGRGWDRATAILTPGDRVEYKLEMKAGGTVMAAVTSDAFDPALAIVDESGTELLKVDDREEGDQSPFLIFKAPKDGKYTLKVLSYRSAAGGKFDIFSRQFNPTDLKVDTPARVGDSRFSFVRIQGVKSKFYDIQSNYGLPLIIGPTGVPTRDYERVHTDAGSILKAKADGDYYLIWGSNGPNDVIVKSVGSAPLNHKDLKSAAVPAGSFFVFEMEVDQHTVVQSNVEGAAGIKVTAPRSDNQGSVGDDIGTGSSRQFSWFRTDIANDFKTVRIFRAKGTAYIALRAGNKDTTIKIENTNEFPEWRDGDSIRHNLKIGEAKFFVLNSNPSELMSVLAKSDTFLAKLDILGKDGDLLNTLSDRKTLVAADNLYFPNQDKFYVRLSCEGYGGSGPFVMTREVYKPTPIKLSERKDVDIEVNRIALVSVELAANKTYQIILPEGFGDGIVVLSDKGNTLGVQALNADGSIIYFLKPGEAGRYRIWIRGNVGKTSVRVVPFDVAK